MPTPASALAVVRVLKFQLPLTQPVRDVVLFWNRVMLNDATFRTSNMLNGRTLSRSSER